MEGFWNWKPPPPSQEFHFSVTLSLKKLGFWILPPPTPLEFLSIFFGVGMDIFWNYEICSIGTLFLSRNELEWY